MSDVFEPLELSAPFALEMAHLGCHPVGHPHVCQPYHGFWQYLRLLGMGKTLSGFSADFLQTLHAHLCGHRDRPAQVLISGCADYSAFAHVWQASTGVAHRPQVTALDVCPTPLALTRWYARHIGASVNTVCSNVLDHHPGPRYDLMVTSSFFGYFSPTERLALFKNYADMLRPGGVFVFTARLRDGDEHQPVGFTPSQADAMVAQVVQALPRLPAPLALAPEQARTLARQYTELLRSYPVNSLDTVRRLAAAAGLQVAQCVQRAGRAASPGATGPTVGSADYLFVTLRKPEEAEPEGRTQAPTA
jgi:SAM-dependent methyltransferase